MVQEPPIATTLIREWEQRLGIRNTFQAVELGAVERAVLEIAELPVDDVAAHLVRLVFSAMPATSVAYVSERERIAQSRDGSEPKLPHGLWWCSERTGSLVDRDAPFYGDAHDAYIVTKCDTGWLVVSDAALQPERVLAFAKLAGAMWMRSRLESVASESAVRDALTGLLNRRGLLDAIERFPRGARYVLLFGDLDGLKVANDTHGHSAGDKLISDTAKVLTTVIRSNDVVARVGGDEFVVVAMDDEPELLVARVRSALRRAGISVSWGTASVPEEFPDAPTAIVEADQRMYQDKRARGSARR